MVIAYMQWHDGDGYDLEALAALSPEERDSLETVLITPLAADWRDARFAIQTELPYLFMIINIAPFLRLIFIF